MREMIPIRVHPFFFLVAFLLALSWTGGDLFLTALTTGVIAISVLVHEFGHAVAGLLFRQKVQITLLPFGGLTERQGRPLKGWQDFLVILMGPVFGFMLYLGAAWLARHYRADIWIIAAQINLAWTLLNLVPILPLDGGQLMRVVLQGIWGVKGLKAACLLSMGLGALLALLAIVLGQFLIGSVFAIFTYESWQLYHDVKFLKDHDTDVTFQRLIAKGEKAHQRGDKEKSHEIFSEVRRQVAGGALYNMATIRLAEEALSQHQFEEGYRLLEPIRKELSIDGVALFQELAFKAEHWQEALVAGTQVAQTSPSADLARQNAEAAAQLGDKAAEEGWTKLFKSFQ